MVLGGSDTGGQRRKRRWLGPLILVLLLAAAAGLVVSWLMFSSWSEVRTATGVEIEQAFSEALAEAGNSAPYLEISAQGTVQIHRELEGDTRVALETFVVLAWEPEGERLVRVDLPYWFVRMKMTDSLNLGTLISVLAKDWKNLDLRVAERDLELRGPGLLLDHTRPDGARILLFTK